MFRKIGAQLHSLSPLSHKTHRGVRRLLSFHIFGRLAVYQLTGTGWTPDGKARGAYSDRKAIRSSLKTRLVVTRTEFLRYGGHLELTYTNFKQ